MASPVQIAVSQLARLIGTPIAPVVIDVRIDEDVATEPFLIPTAISKSHQEVASLVPVLLETAPDKSVVVYCQKGLKLSEGAAAMLRCHGIQAEVLAGGQFAWRDAGLPQVPISALPQHSLWVTRLRPKIDRIACPWLIRRFVDLNAQFLFVSASSVTAVAEKFSATPFDIEDVYWSHRGDECTFDTMINEFGLTTDPLKRLANIVRAADTNRHDLAPEAAGLLAASLGLSRMYSDDLQQLEAGMLLYDSFYRWARDAVKETHDWPSSPSKSAG